MGLFTNSQEISIASGYPRDALGSLLNVGDTIVGSFHLKSDLNRNPNFRVLCYGQFLPRDTNSGLEYFYLGMKKSNLHFISNGFVSKTSMHQHISNSLPFHINNVVRCLKIANPGESFLSRDLDFSLPLDIGGNVLQENDVVYYASLEQPIILGTILRIIPETNQAIVVPFLDNRYIKKNKSYFVSIVFMSQQVLKVLDEDLLQTLIMEKLSGDEWPSVKSLDFKVDDSSLMPDIILESNGSKTLVQYYAKRMDYPSIERKYCIPYFQPNDGMTLLKLT